ncbi:hypothetical protein D3C76_1282260 [compost metagenome]
MEGNDADHITAQAEERGMAEADHGAVADQQIQADRGQAVDGQAGKQADQKRFVQQVGNQWQQGEYRQAQQVDDKTR